MSEILNQAFLLYTFVAIYKPAVNMPRLKKFSNVEVDLLRESVTVLSAFEEETGHTLYSKKSSQARQFITFLRKEMEERFRRCWEDATLLKAATVDSCYAYSISVLPESIWDTAEAHLVSWSIGNVVQPNTDGTILSQNSPQHSDDGYQTEFNAGKLIVESDKERSVKIISTDSAALFKKTQIEAELERYRHLIVSTVRIKTNEDPTNFWKTHFKDFPLIADCARYYLGAPPSSVSSERLFSKAGLLFNDKLWANRSGPRTEQCYLVIARNTSEAKKIRRKLSHYKRSQADCDELEIEEEKHKEQDEHEHEWIRSEEIEQLYNEASDDSGEEEL